MNSAGKMIGGNGTKNGARRRSQERWEGRREERKNDPERRRSLPMLGDPAEDLEPPPSSTEGRECLSLGNSPQGRNNEKSTKPGKEIKTLPRRPTLIRHESLPSLHLNARCIKCDRVGTVYCKGCEAHFCAKHDRIRHRFTLRKKRHQHEALPGISYFRLPLTVDGGNGGGSNRSDNSDLGSEDFDTGSSSNTNTSSNSNGKWKLAVSREKRLKDAGAGGAQRRGEVPSMRSRARGQGARSAGGDGTRGGVQRDQGNSRRRSSASTTASASASAASARDLSRRGWYDKIVMAIVRPPRCKYTQEDLGPTVVPLHSGLAMKRRDFEVRNRRGLTLVCSQWRPAFAEDTSQLPCVVYLHGNSSARVDVMKTRSLAVLSAALCTVVSFDFSGSGMSEGDWVTLGYFEQHDVADVLAYLRSNGMASRYLLWGRSMGAASAMLYAACYPNSDLCGLILDSPFSSFRRLARDLVTGGQIHVPGFLVNGALALLRRSVKKRTRCDLKTLAPIARASSIRCPCLFIAARKDLMVKPHHGAELSEAVGGASLFITCRGSHNSSRPSVVLQAIAKFVRGCFRAPADPISHALVEIQEILADAQESAKARRDRHTSEVGGSSVGGLVPGSAHGLNASGVANGEGKGKGLDGSQRKSISPGARGIGQEIKGPEVRKTTSFDGRDPRTSSLLGPSTETVNTRSGVDANRFDSRQPRRSKSQNAGDSDADRQRRGSARSSNTSSGKGGSDLVLEVGDIEANEVDGIAAEDYDDGDVNVERGVSGKYEKPLFTAAAPTAAPEGVRRVGRGIRGVFPGKSIYETDSCPRSDPHPHRRLEEKPSDGKLRGFGSGGGSSSLQPARTVPGTMRGLCPPLPPASDNITRGSYDTATSVHSAMVKSALTVEGDDREAKSGPRKAEEVAAKGVDGQEDHRPHPRVALSGRSGGVVAGIDTVRDSVTTKRVFGGSADQTRDQFRESLGNGTMISFRVDIRAEAAVAAPGVEGAPTASRRRSNTQQAFRGGGGGGDAGGLWGRMRIRAPPIRAFGRRGKSGGDGGGDDRTWNRNEPLSNFPNMRLERNPGGTRSARQAGVGSGAGEESPYVPRTVSGKLKM